jgi:hypothetical protein
MIKDVLALAIAALILYLLSACAAEREAPIYKWRVAYGFEPARPE